MDNRTLYQILGVEPTASLGELRDAFRKLARQCHPDVQEVSDGGARFREINEAYSILSDKEKRQKYDTSLVSPHAEPVSETRPFNDFFGGPLLTRAEYLEIFRDLMVRPYEDMVVYYRTLFGIPFKAEAVNQVLLEMPVTDWALVQALFTAHTEANDSNKTWAIARDSESRTKVSSRGSEQGNVAYYVRRIEGEIATHPRNEFMPQSPQSMEYIKALMNLAAKVAEIHGIEGAKFDPSQEFNVITRVLSENGRILSEPSLSIKSCEDFWPTAESSFQSLCLEKQISKPPETA